MEKFSKNIKLNAALNGILELLKKVDYVNITYLKENYPKEIDYNIASFGELFVYSDDIRAFYKECGYAAKWSDDQLWTIYRRHVGYVVRRKFKSI